MPRAPVNNRRLVAISVGETPRAGAEAAIERHLGRTSLRWLDRTELRRRPLPTLAHLMRSRYAGAVLVAPDLKLPRLLLTSMLLGLIRADQRWRIDLLGNCQRFSPRGHLSRHLWTILRHLLASGLALAFAEPLLRAIEAFTRPRQIRLTSPRRVLYLRSQLWLGLEGGGSVAHTAGVIGGLAATGVDVHVVSSDRLPGVAVQTTVVPPAMWFDGWLREAEDLAYNIAFFGAALRSARRTQPQAIYQRHTAFNCSGAILSRLLRLPLVLEYNSSEVWKGRYWGGLRLIRAAALVERINLLAADRIVVVSRVLADHLQSAGLSPTRIVVNPNAVDVNQFRPDVDGSGVRQRLGLEPTTIVVGFSGTFGKWHGIPTLAAALAPVLAARSDVSWLLIGDGALRRLVEAAVERHGLHDRVRQPGMVPHAEMPAHLAACDVLVSPHGRQVDGGEFFGSPTKLYEYMAAGRPIVASAVGQIAQVLQDEQTALLVPPDDVEALSRAIVRLVDDAALRLRLGQAARRAAIEGHTWRQNAHRLLASFEG